MGAKRSCLWVFFRYLRSLLIVVGHRWHGITPLSDARGGVPWPRRCGGLYNNNDLEEIHG